MTHVESRLMRLLALHLSADGGVMSMKSVPGIQNGMFQGDNFPPSARYFFSYCALIMQIILTVIYTGGHKYKSKVSDQLTIGQFLTWLQETANVLVFPLISCIL